MYVGYTAHKLYGYRLEIVLENVPDCFPSLEFPETEHLTAFACKCTNKFKKELMIPRFFERLCYKSKDGCVVRVSITE